MIYITIGVLLSFFVSKWHFDILASNTTSPDSTLRVNNIDAVLIMRVVTK